MRTTSSSNNNNNNRSSTNDDNEQFHCHEHEDDDDAASLTNPAPPPPPPAEEQEEEDDDDDLNWMVSTNIRRHNNMVLLAMLTAAAAAAAVDAATTNTTVRRSPSSSYYCRDRLEWNSHVAELLQEGDGAFRRLYRMNHTSFMKLCHYIHPIINRDESMSRIRSVGKGPITTEMALHCLLRWLSGGSHLDIRLCVGISTASFYRLLYQCISAILLAKELQYNFPTSEDEINKAAASFTECSMNNAVMEGCVAALDGMLLRITTPAATEAGNVKAFFSGHYQEYGINVQAACDSECRFVYAALAAPGGANDIAAHNVRRKRQEREREECNDIETTI